MKTPQPDFRSDGRCGFDPILVGDSLKNASIEITKILKILSQTPTLARMQRSMGRSFDSDHYRYRRQLDPEIRHYRSADQAQHGATVSPIDIGNVEGHLFSPSQNQKGVVLLASEKLINGSGLNLMIIADTKRTARDQLEVVTRLLTK